MKIVNILFILVSALVISYALLSNMYEPATLNVQHKHITGVDQIIPFSDTLVVPVLYDTMIIESMAPVPVQKEQFIAQVLPAILVVKYEIEQKSNSIEQIIEKINNNEQVMPADIAFADSLKERFRAKDYQNLLIRMKAHPTSLVLAQAAVESGWGRSRFATQGNNLFGVWASRYDANAIRALGARDGQSVFLKKYNNIAESIDHYFLTLGRHNAYQKFRIKRWNTIDVFDMLVSLDKYSELGNEYTLLLQKMIKWNDLEKYDHYIIDPQFFVRESLWQVYSAKCIENIKARFEKMTVREQSVVTPIDSLSESKN